MIINITFVICLAVLYRLGGSRNKLYRRLGIPLLIAFHSLLTHHWVGLLALPYGFIVFTLPVTLKGDDIHAHWYNWLWLPILGFLIGFITFSLYKATVFTVVFTTLVVLSNVKKTAQLFTWDRCELLFGAMLGVLL